MFVIEITSRENKPKSVDWK